MKIINVVGTRPNFIKIAPVLEAMNRHPSRFEHMLVHTGQHYDEKMSKAFFEDLGMPKPDLDLKVGSGSHAEQTAKIMVEFEKICIREQPDIVLVAGDVNSTLACAITAKKLGIRVAHVEAGLRSRDMTMPEEINRLCTDVICDYLFTTDRIADENLLNEGVHTSKIHFVGNVMIDTLLKHRDLAARMSLSHDLGVVKGGFATLTLHRPSNVDHPAVLGEIFEALRELSKSLPIIFPVHPRTRKMIEQFGFGDLLSKELPVRGIWTTEPLGYLEFLHLNMNARLVLTDSGGLQEETTALGVPCITLRENTERPVTCISGTNQLVGYSRINILAAVERVFGNEIPIGTVPEKWDGKAADRIVEILMATEFHKA